MAGDVLDLFSQVPQDTFPNMNDRKKCNMSAASNEDIVPLVRNNLSNAILASGAPVPHYALDADGNQQSLSVRDVAALQSYPNDYEFYGTLTSKYKQVGNSVPCCLATALAGAAANVLRFIYSKELSEPSNTMSQAATAAVNVVADAVHYESSETQAPHSNFTAAATTTASAERQSWEEEESAATAAESAATTVATEEKKQDDDDQQQISAMDSDNTPDNVLEEDVEMVTTRDGDGAMEAI